VSLPKIWKRQILLRGGKKPIMVEAIKRKKLLHGGTEGKVYEIEATIKKGEKIRTITLAEKEFHSDISIISGQKRQFKIMQELLKLNREKKLGLRIVPTIRFRRRWWKSPTLIITKLEEIPRPDFSPQQTREFSSDIERQKITGENNGYYLGEDAFIPVLDKKTGRAIAVITDFGEIKRFRKKKL